MTTHYSDLLYSLETAGVVEPLLFQNEENDTKKSDMTHLTTSCINS